MEGAIIPVTNAIVALRVANVWHKQDVAATVQVELDLDDRGALLSLHADCVELCAEVGEGVLDGSHEAADDNVAHKVHVGAPVRHALRHTQVAVGVLQQTPNEATALCDKGIALLCGGLRKVGEGEYCVKGESGS